jgi:hypothetical protein
MAFNREAKKRRGFLGKIRSLPGCERVRPSDLDGLDEKDMREIFHLFKGDPKRLRTALHGMGETFVPQDYGSSPYKTSPLVNYQGPEFGGNRRYHNAPFPGAGDQHINDDGDKEKHTRGEAASDDFDPDMKRVKINDAIDALTDKKQYTIRLRFPENQQPTKQKAIELFGPDAQTDGTSVYVVIKGYKKALDMMNGTPGCVLEPS